MLAANLSLPRTSLSTVYNYAFRRDRERLPPDAGRLLRAGIFGDIAVNIHFVADGKPWQHQNLTAYPGWLAAARLWYVSQWHKLARAVQPSPWSVLSQQELQTFGDVEAFQIAQRSNGTLLGIIDSSSMLACRCFLRDLVDGGPKTDPLTVLKREAMLAGSQHAWQRNLTEQRRRRGNILDQRKQLSIICNAARAKPSELGRCKQNKEEAVRRAAFWKRGPSNSSILEMYPAFVKFLDDFKAVPVKSKYADSNQCKLAHWYSRIKQDNTTPRKELNRQLGTATVNALIARVASLPRMKKPRGGRVQLSKIPCSFASSSNSKLRQQRALTKAPSRRDK